MKGSFEQDPKSQLNRDELMTGTYIEASQGKRFSNFVVDSVCILLLMIPVSISIIKGLMYLDKLGYIVLYPGIPVSPIFEPVLICAYFFTYLVFYSSFEFVLGKTIGKMMTRTRVLKAETGTKPGFWRIIGRSFARLIPFDTFSFLFGRGFHDKLSNTVVVNDDSVGVPNN